MLAPNCLQTAHCFSIRVRERRIIRIRHVFLEAERRRHEVDLHSQRFAKRQHDRGRLRRGQAGQFVDRQLAQDKLRPTAVVKRRSRARRDTSRRDASSSAARARRRRAASRTPLR